jgi:nicotinamidase-related amidase
VKTLILTGLTADSCVLFTAADAFVRDLHLIVAEDCVASIDPGDSRRALRDMARAMGADVCASAAVDLARLRRPRAA